MENHKEGQKEISNEYNNNFIGIAYNNSISNLYPTPL